jgi:hypothetical protein
MCNLQAVIIPNEKLKKMLIFAKIILIINILSALVRLIIRPSDMIYDLFTSLFLFMAYNSVYFIYMAIYLIFCFFNMIFLFISSGIIFQMLIQKTLGELKDYAGLILGVQLYLFVFYIFAIIFTFPIYKEMKAQFLENNGLIGRESRDQADVERPSGYNNIGNNQPNSNANQQNAQSNSQAGFVAFSGRGVVVG